MHPCTAAVAGSVRDGNVSTLIEVWKSLVEAVASSSPKALRRSFCVSKVLLLFARCCLSRVLSKSAKVARSPTYAEKVLWWERRTKAWKTFLISTDVSIFPPFIVMLSGWVKCFMYVRWIVWRRRTGTDSVVKLHEIAGGGSKKRVKLFVFLSMLKKIVFFARKHFSFAFFLRLADWK